MKHLQKAIPMLLLALVLVAGITLLAPQVLAAENDDFFVDDFVDGEMMDDFSYEIVDDYAVVTAGNPLASFVYIPHSLDGYPVKVIAECAFYYCPELTDIMIPSSVEYIGEYAFAECYNLWGVYLPESVTEIAYGTFSYCTNMQEVYIPASVEYISANAFEGCESLSYVYYGGSQSQWNRLLENTWDGNDALRNVNVYCEGGSVSADIDGDGTVNNNDVVLLLWHTLFPQDYPISGDVDLTGDGNVNNDDVVLLLWHTLFPEDYPL